MSNQQLTTQAKEKINTIMAMLEARKNQFKDLLPKYLTPEKLFRVAQTAISKSPQLLNCTPASLCISLMDAAQTGLEVNGKDAALVPYGNQCQFQPMYQGMVKQAINSGAAKKIQARLVYANDDFDLWYDPEPKMKHIPALEDQGEIIGAYSYAILPDGDLVIEFMNRRQLDHIRNRAKAKSGPWQTDEEEMYRKTPTKRLFKYLPIPQELEYAVAIDNQIESGSNRLEVPLLDLPPEDLREKKQTVTEKLVEKTTKRGRPPKETQEQPDSQETTSPDAPGDTISEPPLVNHSPETPKKPIKHISSVNLALVSQLSKAKDYPIGAILQEWDLEEIEMADEEQGEAIISFLRGLKEPWLA